LRLSYLETAEALDQCRVMRFQSHRDQRGALFAFEPQVNVPFEIRRVFFITEVPAGSRRAGHANRALDELLVVLKGSMKATLRSPDRERTVVLDDPSAGLYVHAMTWLQLERFSTGALVAVFASLPYEQDDHITDFSEFAKLYRDPTAR